MTFLRNNLDVFTQRRDIDSQLGCFLSNDQTNVSTIIRPEIKQSWERCLASEQLNQKLSCVPSEDNHLIKNRWDHSNLEQIAKKELVEIMQLAKEGSLVAAISDIQGNILWTCASQHMQKRAESINFSAGGKWDDCSAGTNAISLALRQRAPVTVFSSEHYLSHLHDWVCYASPIVHPKTKKLIGVLDLSTTWDRHTVLGQAAVSQLSNSIALRLPDSQPDAELEIMALGESQIIFQGESLTLTHRQVEILCLLALNPSGLSLDALHANLYGDSPVCKSTLKAEISRLRKLLNGKIDSRPYRLTSTVRCDFIDFWGAISKKNAQEAISLFRGAFLSKTNSPVLGEWQRCVDMAVTQISKTCQNKSSLIEGMCHSSDGYELVRERLVELLD